MPFYTADVKKSRIWDYLRNEKYVELPIGFNVPMPYICKNVINGDKLSPTLKIQICHDT